MYTPFIEDDETVDQYCDDMEKDGCWGGQLEMNALAHCHNFNVIVHQVDNPSMAQVFHEPVGKDPTLHISYHLGEHFNSIRRGDDPIMRGAAPIKHFPIGHDLEKVKKMLEGMDLNLHDTKGSNSKEKE